jgi:hypothetical protein
VLARSDQKVRRSLGPPVEQEAEPARQQEASFSLGSVARPEPAARVSPWVFNGSFFCDMFYIPSSHPSTIYDSGWMCESNSRVLV